MDEPAQFAVNARAFLALWKADKVLRAGNGENAPTHAMPYRHKGASSRKWNIAKRAIKASVEKLGNANKL